MQTKINAFFKPRSTQNPNPNHDILCQENDEIDSICISASQKKSVGCSIQGSDHLENTSTSNKNFSNKRSYAQLHLDLGQSDFLLRHCFTCSFKYACGDKEDEKLHKEFHKDYTHGIEFKGWQNERVVQKLSSGAGRIILVLDEDPAAHKKKVEKVLQMMEVELRSGSLINKQCKVYLYILQRRVVGCLIVQPISEAYRVLTKAAITSCTENGDKKNIKDLSVLNFGGIQLQQVASSKSSSENKGAVLTADLMGAIFLEKEAVPAVCGIRAIWVVSAMRRKRIASQLLDTARMTFCQGIVLDHSQVAFSDPTSVGRALASRYCGPRFLAYRADC